MCCDLRIVSIRSCAVCEKLLPLAEFSWNQAKCKSCKSSYDKLYHMCSRKQLGGWFSEICQHPTKLKNLTKEYELAMKKFAAGETSQKFSVVEYKERLQSSQELDCVERGRFMSEARYLSYATSNEPEEGPISLTEAKARWTAWAADPKSYGLITKGNPKDSSFRIRVVTGHDMDVHAKFARIKDISITTDKPIKNASQEDVEALASRLRGGHSSIAGGALDFAGMQMDIGEAGASSFLDRDLNFDPRALVRPTEVVKDEASDHDNEEDEAGGSGSSGPDKKKAKTDQGTQSWSSREKAVKDAKHSCTEQFAKLASDFEDMHSTLNLLECEAKTWGPSELAFLQEELAIVKNRNVALSMLKRSASDLDTWKQSFNKSMQSGVQGSHDGSAMSSSGGPQKIQCNIGSAPPCTSYMELKTLSEIEGFIVECLLCETKDELGAFKETFRSMLRPTMQLIGQGRQAKASCESV